MLITSQRFSYSFISGIRVPYNWENWRVNDVNWEKMGRAIHLLVCRSSNGIAIILYVPRLMPKVTNSCDEEEWPQNSSQNLHKYPWCTTLPYSHGYFCSFSIELNTLASGTMPSGAQLSESEWVRLRISTSPLFALFTCCWMSFEAV